MIEERSTSKLTFWKTIVVSIVAPLLSHLLRRWLSEPVAFGVGFFLAFLPIYQLPPYVGRRPSLVRTLLACTACGAIVFLLTKFV